MWKQKRIWGSIMIKNKRGLISVEALLTVTIFVLLMSFLISLLQLFYIEDVLSQKVFDSVDELEKMNYLLEKIGDVHLEDLAIDNLPIDLKEYTYLNTFLNSEYQDQNKDVFLRHHFETDISQVMDRYKVVNDWSLEEFVLLGDRLSIDLTYKHHLPFKIQLKPEIQVNKTLWLFGDDPTLSDHQTLADILGNFNDFSVSTYVYTTKTGVKYHLKTCFYINRTTTDQSKIKRLSLKEALAAYFLPCKRCILK